MNEFTKEELIKIKDAMYGISFDDNEERILRKKIQSMIDNYCEHEYMTFLQDHNNEPFMEKCMECHTLRFLNDN